MILFVITKIIAVILAVYIVRKVRFTRMHSKMFGLSLLAGIGFTLLAVSPLVLNVPKVLMTVSIDLAILCLAIAGIMYYVQARAQDDQ